MIDHPTMRLVVIDTWSKVAPKPKTKQTQYQDDYDAITPLKALADKYNVAIVAIHHLRKTASEANDVLDEVSGSVGLTGAVDGFLVLKRERGQFDATLHVTGRDIED